ncbi:MAG: DUF4912 domain-containing protein [Treponemataceae bacterium]|nr:DUF4912 domain-containing protein [Treponemataceae bacterium]
MENKAISLAYLESLSTADLLLLADEYGVDIPEQLNRSFVISELFEIADEMNEEEDNVEMEETGSPVKTATSLPETYNETQIDLVLRTPVWAYVFWDISNSDLQDVIEAKNFSKLILKTNFWDGISHEKPVDSFELSVSAHDKAQYILIPSEQKEFSIDLIAEFTNKEKSKLASSRLVKIPESAPEITIDMLDRQLSPIMEASGMRNLIKKQYESNRQSN